MKVDRFKFFKRHLSMTVFWAAVFCFGQGEGGTIRATFEITDGVGLPGVEVTLTSDDWSGTQISDIEGRVVFKEVPPGCYELLGVFDGYNPSLRPGIFLEEGENQAFKFKMTVPDKDFLVINIDETYVNLFPKDTDTTLDTEELQVVPIGSGPQPFLKFLPEVAPLGYLDATAKSRAWFDRRSWVLDGLDIPEDPATTSFLNHLNWHAFERIHLARLGNHNWREFTGVDLARMGNSLLVNDFGNTSWVKTIHPGNEHKGSMGLLVSDRSTNRDYLGNVQADGEGFEKVFDLGGPILKDKLWYWAGYQQNEVESLAMEDETDRGTVENRHLKLLGILGPRTAFKASYRRFSNDRLPSITGFSEWTGLQEGDTRVSKISISQVLGITTELELAYAGLRSDNAYTFAQQSPEETPLRRASGILGLEGWKRADETVWDQFEINGLSFAFFGRFEHEISYGLYAKDIMVAHRESWSDGLGFSLNPRVDLAGPGTFSAFGEGRARSRIRSQSAWLEDFLVINDFNLVFGFRMNRSEASHLSVDGGTTHPLFPEIFAVPDSDERVLPFEYRTFAPKLSVGYEVNQRWLDNVKIGYRKYFDRLEDSLVTHFHSGRSSGIVGYAQDLDASGVIESDELGFATDSNGQVVPYLGNETAQDPFRFRPLGLTDSQLRNVRIDPELQPPEIDEYQVRADWNFADVLSFTATFSHLRRSKEQLAFVQLAPGRLLDQSDLVPGYQLSGSHPDTGMPWMVELGLISSDAATLLEQNGRVFIGNDPSSTELNRFDFIGAWCKGKWSCQLHAVFSDFHQSDDSGLLVLNEAFNGNGPLPSSGVLSLGENAAFDRKPGAWGVSLVAIHQFSKRTTLAGNYSAKAYDIGPRFVTTGGFFDGNGVSADRWVSIDQPGQTREGVLSNVDIKFTHRLKLGRTSLDLAVEAFNLFDVQEPFVRDNAYGIHLNQGTGTQNFDEDGAGVFNPNFGDAIQVTPPRRLRFSAVIRF